MSSTYLNSFPYPLSQNTFGVLLSSAFLNLGSISATDLSVRISAHLEGFFFYKINVGKTSDGKQQLRESKGVTGGHERQIKNEIRKWHFDYWAWFQRLGHIAIFHDLLQPFENLSTTFSNSWTTSILCCFWKILAISKHYFRPYVSCPKQSKNLLSMPWSGNSLMVIWEAQARKEEIIIQK